MLGAAFTLALSAATAAADIITLTNGHVIEADRAWYEGTQLRYEKNGGVFGIPRGMVRSLDKAYAPEAAGDPDLATTIPSLPGPVAIAHQICRRWASGLDSV